MKIKIGEGEYEYTRPPLRKWLALEDERVNLYNAIASRNIENIAQSIISAVSFALDIPNKKLENRPWYEIGSALLIIFSANTPKFDFPFLRAKIQDKKDTWDYQGRTWYIWVDLFAERYGWDVETIANLDVDDAIALAQETAVDHQLEKEWDWMTSWVAYQGENGFKPLDRPSWMASNREPFIPKKMKIRKEFMPVGIIVRFSPSDNAEGSGTV